MVLVRLKVEGLKCDDAMLFFDFQRLAVLVLNFVTMKQF